MAIVEIKKEEAATENLEAANEREKKEIEKLKFTVGKLSEELNTAVAELKRSIIDIRSAVSEIENPFNLMRVISSEKDLKKMESERLPLGVKSLEIGKAEEKPAGKTEEKIVSQPPAPVQIMGEKAEAKAERGEYRPAAGVFPPAGTVYLDWGWSLLDVGFSPDDVRQLSQSYERLGFLPEGVSEQIYSLAVAAEKAKSRGLTKSRLLLNMYKASVISGMGMNQEDLKRLISMAEERSESGEKG